MSKETRSAIRRAVLSAVVIFAVVGALYLVARWLGWTEIDRDDLQQRLQRFIEERGVLAPLIYILISFLQVTFVPIPGAVTILAGNYVFGTWQAFLYSYIGMLGGAMFAFALGKWIGRPFVNWIAGSPEKVDAWLSRLHGRENVLLFFMFFLPFFPDDVLCAVAGILPIGWTGFFIMQLITRMTSVGATLLLMSGEVIPWSGWGIPVLAAIGVLAIVAFIVSYRNAERINTALQNFADRITKKQQK
ncbi:MAG: TVP38/TMEM64 family protein [Clostridia bacterium]|nr:TVP38/TMEM64 family protein [Clostridia bacterium]